ncbi:MAG: TSUP family transporter [Acidimicrobiales bacterium]
MSETIAAEPAVADAPPPFRSVFRQRLVWGLPALFTVGWFIYVTAADHWGRVADTWRTALTMLFGSFVAGSTPQGGGAVAFPVFTKVLEITAPVARTFSLSIQATGMVMASATIILAGRAIDKRAIAYGTGGGLIGFAIGAFVLSDPSKAWWPSYIPGPYVKVGFTVAIAAMAYIVFLCFADGAKGHSGITTWGLRSRLTLIGFTTLGGIASALAGSGVDVLLFLFVVLVAGMHPRVGIPTSIITMAVVSVAGFLVFGIYDGQLAIELNHAGDVVAAGDNQFSEPLDGERFDLFGIWLGATPIVVWGAPLGSWVASVLPQRRLIQFVAFMAVAEVLTTIIFLDALRSDLGLVLFGIGGLVLAMVAIRVLVRTRAWIMQT